MISDLICSKSNTLLEVMHLINENCKSTCFVECPKIGLIGVVTDGDIRRALLAGKSLDSSIFSIMNVSYTFASIQATLSELDSKISSDVKIIPIVNSENKVVSFYERDGAASFPVSTPILSGNELAYLTDAFLSTWISSNGDYLDKFEEGFSKFSDCEFGVSVSNGTSALHLALMALGIKSDDEVIIPNLTFAATANTVLHANATPVIVDVDDESWCICPAAIEKAITTKTKAIMPVHLYGQPCDMTSIMRIAKKHNLFVIEDCAEAHGAKFNGKKVGSFGDIGCFSFYGNKVITTGEGGMCVTNSGDLKRKMLLLKNHGMSKEKKYWHEVVGYNYRMTNLQAALGVAQLERIDNILESRRLYEQDYRDALVDKNVNFQANLNDRERIIWLVSILLGETYDRDQVIRDLKTYGVDARPFFIPLSNMPIYKKYSQGDVSNSLRISRAGISLPTNESRKSSIEIQNILKKVF
jgi:perosamine synthetase